METEEALAHSDQETSEHYDNHEPSEKLKSIVEKSTLLTSSSQKSTSITLQPNENGILKVEASDDKDLSPPSFLLWSILNNALCWTACGFSLFCSIPALIFSLCTKSVYGNDERRAKRFSLSAYIFNIMTCIFLMLSFSLFYIFNLRSFMASIFRDFLSD